MNFTDTFKSVELVLKAGEVPLLVGETGIGKTSLARELAAKNDWSLVGIDGNLLKEGEIGGLPTVEAGTTIYAVHHKLRKIDEEIAKGRTVLLFIDEINRCDHAVQQELMNLILNREINGYVLSPSVHIIAAMNPADSYDYEVVEMDAAQQNRFVWLYMEADYLQWLDWASTAGIEEKVMEFISTFPEYLDKTNEDDINACRAVTNAFPNCTTSINRTRRPSRRASSTTSSAATSASSSLRNSSISSRPTPSPSSLMTMSSAVYPWIRPCPAGSTVKATPGSTWLPRTSSSSWNMPSASMTAKLSRSFPA